MEEMDRFVVLYNKQREFMDYLDNKGRLPTLKDTQLALFTEVGEWANELALFKTWKTSHEINRAKVLEEFIDILFFWLQALIMMHFSVEEVVEEYLRKWDENVRRQQSGY